MGSKHAAALLQGTWHGSYSLGLVVHRQQLSDAEVDGAHEAEGRGWRDIHMPRHGVGRHCGVRVLPPDAQAARTVLRFGAQGEAEAAWGGHRDGTAAGYG